MKRCSTCNRTYTDPNLSFCIDDGTPLTTVDADDDATVVTPRGNETDRNAVAYQPPRAYVPPGTPVKRRRAWPWVVGILGAFILGILVIGIAAAFLAPRMIRRLEQEAANAGGHENSNANSNTAEANTNSTERVDTPPPADHQQVLAQLTEIENEWTVANLNADKKKLDRILADDFVGQADEGGLQSKADYLRGLKRDTSVDKWEFKDLKLTLIGDRATLTGTITYFVDEQTVVFDFTDKFVWRDGRWQATGAEIKQKESSDVTL
jgi:Domain of unknown function (DUF4440)